MSDILCGFIPGQLQSVTVEANSRYAPSVNYVNMQGSPYNYWQAVTDRWTGEETLITIEQDIQIGPETISSFEECAEPWCVFSYNVYETELTNFSLGCAKFTVEAQKLITIPRVSYLILDVWILEEFQKVGITPHDHGPVAHHHDYSGIADSLPVYQAAYRKFKDRLRSERRVFPECRHGSGNPHDCADKILEDMATIFIRDEDGEWVEYEPDKHDSILPYLNQLNADRDAAKKKLKAGRGRFRRFKERMANGASPLEASEKPEFKSEGGRGELGKP